MAQSTSNTNIMSQPEQACIKIKRNSLHAGRGFNCPKRQLSYPVMPRTEPAQYVRWKAVRINAKAWGKASFKAECYGFSVKQKADRA